LASGDLALDRVPDFAEAEAFHEVEFLVPVRLDANFEVV
jgi:hypothetical protein